MISPFGLQGEYLVQGGGIEPLARPNQFDLKSMGLLDIAFTDVYFLPHFNKPFNFILTAILKVVGLDYEAVKKRV